MGWHAQGNARGRRLIVSAEEGLAEIGPGSGCVIARMPLEGANSICFGRDALYCAADDGAIWRIHPESFVPMALFFCGPGINSLCLHAREERLYALCADADSLLMCCARTGQPLLVNRAGVNPQGMAYAEKEGMIAVAGGEQEAVLLFDDQTLQLLDVLPMPGMVSAVAVSHGRIYALCMDETLSSILVTVRQRDARRSLRLPGPPGLLEPGPESILAAAKNRLYAVSAEGDEILSCVPMPGRAGKLFGCPAQDGAIMLDRVSQVLYIRSGLCWRMLMRGVRDAVML